MTIKYTKRICQGTSRGGGGEAQIGGTGLNVVYQLIKIRCAPECYSNRYSTSRFTDAINYFAFTDAPIIVARFLPSASPIDSADRYRGHLSLIISLLSRTVEGTKSESRRRAAFASVERNLRARCRIARACRCAVITSGGGHAFNPFPRASSRPAVICPRYVGTCRKADRVAGTKSVRVQHPALARRKRRAAYVKASRWLRQSSVFITRRRTRRISITYARNSRREGTPTGVPLN